MTKKNRTFAFMLAFIVCFVMLFSSIFIIVETDHACTKEHCPICYQISICENTLKTLSNVIPSTVIVVALTYFLMNTLPAFIVVRRVESLVTLKIKLSN